MIGTGQAYSARKSKALLYKVLAGVVRSLLRDPDWYNFGRLINEGLDNSVSQVQVNIVGNIETILEFAIVSRYSFAAVAAAYFESKLPANTDFANNCQQRGLDLDYIQFERLVQVKKLVVRMTLQ